ncbi:unnamed protein product [Tenebrio molitor]|nr:unnamed protein product [Tenebrio molitor]
MSKTLNFVECFTTILSSVVNIFQQTVFCPQLKWISGKSPRT